MIASGSNRRFRHTVATTASRDAIWSLWTRPETWGSWDQGLKSAEGPPGGLMAGATGTIRSRGGQRAPFKVVEWQDREAYAFTTALPLATLAVRRRFEAGEMTRFTHDVSFSGPLAALWSMILGPGFRQALPPTMETLARLAETQAIEARP